MERCNIKDLWKISKTQAQPLLGSRANLSQLPFMEGYLANDNYFDRNLALTKGFLNPLWNLDEEPSVEAVLSSWRSDCYGFFLKNYSNLNHLYELMLVDYKPLENYNMTEKTKSTDSGTDTMTDIIGVKENTITNGSHTDTHNIGTSTDSDVYGEQTDNDVYGAQTDSSSNEVSAFNSASFVDTDKNTTQNGSHTDNHTKGTHTDSHTKGAQENSDTYGQYTVTNHEDEHTDVKTNDYGKINNTEIEKFGNLGVTTSQQMAQSEVDLWGGPEAFKFYDILFNMLVAELCTYIEED